MSRSGFTDADCARRALNLCLCFSRASDRRDCSLRVPLWFVGSEFLVCLGFLGVFLSFLLFVWFSSCGLQWSGWVLFVCLCFELLICLFVVY